MTQKPDPNPDLSRLAAIDHVEVQARAGLEDKLLWFYRDFVGLKTSAAHDQQDDEPILCFQSERLELRVTMTEQPPIESVHVRLHLEVASLGVAAAILDEHKYPYRWRQGLAFSDRQLVLLDPAGNRVSLRKRGL